MLTDIISMSVPSLPVCSALAHLSINHLQPVNAISIAFHWLVDFLPMLRLELFAVKG